MAFVSAIAVAFPTALYVVLFGVLNIDLGSGSIVVLVLATLVGLLGPVLGIVVGVRALRRCRAAPRVGGGLMVAGCALQALLMIVMCIALPMQATVVIAMMVLVGAGTLPALLNLIGGILGLQRATMS